MASERISDIIGEDAAGVLDEVRSTLSDLCELADRVDARGELARNAHLVHEHVDEFFLLMVVGEVKSGKSSFINALLKEKIQAEGPLPLTDRIWVLKYGDEPSERIRDEFVYEREHPNELLRLFNMVDTPGTNSILRKHQDITEAFLPKADLTLFITSIDRPFSESEHQFLNLISDRWRKKILFILTKIDTHEPQDIPKVVDYIKENCRKFYDFEPLVFPVSAKLANSGAEGSGMPELEEYLASRLAEQERVRLKLMSPAESGLALLCDLDRACSERRTLLEGDFASLTDLDTQVEQAGKELKERYNVYVVRFYDLLREFERRGKNFFEATLRIKNFGLLRSPENFQRRFEKEVVGDLKEKIQENMDAATDWLMKEQIGLFERSLRYLTDHLAVDKYKERVAAPNPGEQSFDYHRDTLVGAMQESFQREIERFDIEGECNRVTETAYRGVLQQLGVQVGAVGLGALLVSILTGAMLDVTGVLAAGVIFATGFVILPRKKRQSIQQFSLKVDALIREFRQVLAREFDREIDGASERLRAGYAPYLTFYRAETSFLTESDESAKALRMRLLGIIDAVQALHGDTTAEANPE